MKQNGSNSFLPTNTHISKTALSGVTTRTYSLKEPTSRATPIGLHPVVREVT